MNDDLAGYSPDTFANALTLANIALDPKALATNLKALDAKIAEFKKAEAAIAGEKAEWAQEKAAQEAELAKLREETTATAEAWATRNAQQCEERAQLREIQADIRTEGDRFKREIMRYSGLNEHFNERLQMLPDWSALARIALGHQPDPHLSGDHQDLRGDAATVTEPMPDVPPGVTLTRSRESTAAERRSMRRVDH